MTSVTTVTDPQFNVTKDMTRRPVLVYGTLRYGQGNYEWCVKPYDHTIRTVELDGFKMYGKIGFPYVVPSPGNRIVAELITFLGPDATYHEALSGLDSLEGYFGTDETGEQSELNHYDRIITVLPTGEEAYIYVANESMYHTLSEDEVLVAGDWVNRAPYKPRFVNPTYDFLND